MEEGFKNVWKILKLSISSIKFTDTNRYYLKFLKLLTFSIIKQLLKLYWIASLKLISKWITFMVFVNILLMSAKLKIVILHKHGIMISIHEVIFNNITRYFLHYVNISLWIKFGSHTLYRTKALRKYIL